MTTTEFVIWLIAIAIALAIAGAIALRHRQASRRDEANRVRAAELREEAARQQEEREESQLHAREAELEAESAPGWRPSARATALPRRSATPSMTTRSSRTGSARPIASTRTPSSSTPTPA